MGFRGPGTILESFHHEASSPNRAFRNRVETDSSAHLSVSPSLIHCALGCNMFLHICVSAIIHTAAQLSEAIETISVYYKLHKYVHIIVYGLGNN